ncbi:CapA family protein [Methylocystis sp. L43]|jgi:poly-gamma-glutamate capsule biosynthesis protein CapA/YwtB (metallophosphatase superfamily)|uniref:CapA family protein n=1 Tax=unclassified Methylocystis TaxID=2625913 RepID=UPI0018C32994|nr:MULTISPECIES: CapA family protein [unclassified Methylocystis]MBG0798210.1 CapA family protein [Methylocystis sp. L43]MBG0805705.1 CapA family protein [Methylocystis sp. H15]
MSEAAPRGDGAPAVRLFLCGDVMIGRGVDQILPSPCPPNLYEEYVSSAHEYVRLAEAASGPIPRPVDPSYIWGDVLAELETHAPDARIINLETSVTRSETAEHKAINYRVSPQNAECLRAAGIDCCALANNHVLDWGPSGLLETLGALERLNIAVAGAGRSIDEARRPAIIEIPSKGRVVVLSFALPDSGTPFEWAATPSSPGVNLLPDLSAESAAFACDLARSAARSEDILVMSIHWGSNWGYGVSNAQRQFAHRLIEDAGASVVHGHSSHHARGFEVHRNRLALYGCGDFLNDYEGISGNEGYRGDLSLMHFVDLDTNGDLIQLRLVPLHMRRFRLERASTADAEWLAQTLDRESAPFGVRVRRQPDGALSASWSGGEGAPRRS